MNKNVLIAMSGGIDSSVVAHLMKEKGYNCVGATMKLFYNDSEIMAGDPSCCTSEDIEDAKKVAAHLDIPYHLFNFTDGFKECVMQRFVDAYECGMTPNPCVECNRYMKFEKLYNEAKKLGCEYIATGHYARIEYDEARNRYLLKKAVDLSKDQSYVLYSLSKELLAHTLFPLGELTKPETRSIAEKHGFINPNKSESQDICFVPDGSYAAFIEKFTGKQYPEGDFVDLNGNVLGRHKGIIRYTVGQRKGLGLSLKEPMYVAKVDIENNTVVLARDNELYSDSLKANRINLISVDRIDEPMRITAKIRYRHNEQPATVVQLDDDTISIKFDEPQRAITKGQAVVMYDGEVVVGGGTII